MGEVLAQKDLSKNVIGSWLYIFSKKYQSVIERPFPWVWYDLDKITGSSYTSTEKRCSFKPYRIATGLLLFSESKLLLRGFLRIYLAIPGRNCRRLSPQILDLWPDDHYHIYNIWLEIALLWRRNHIWFLSVLTTVYRRFSYLMRTGVSILFILFFVMRYQDSISRSTDMRQYSIFYNI
jgi:hypothetical protein